MIPSSSWDVVAASPASVCAGVPHKRTSPFKRASDLHTVSHLSGRWERGSCLQTPKTNPAQELIVEGRQKAWRGHRSPGCNPKDMKMS